MSNVLYIPTSGPVTAGPLGGLDEMSEYVGGYVERVSLTPHLDMWVAECSKVGPFVAPYLTKEEYPLNIRATLLYTSMRDAKDLILGDAILTGGVDEMGEGMPLEPEALHYWVAEWFADSTEDAKCDICQTRAPMFDIMTTYMRQVEIVTPERTDVVDASPWGYLCEQCTIMRSRMKIGLGWGQILCEAGTFDSLGKD